MFSIFTDQQYDTLRTNMNAQKSWNETDGSSFDPYPVVKLFTPDAQCTWLITEIDEDGLMFGLCDLGMGEPELGYVSLEEITSVKGPLGLKVEVDIVFKANKPLSAYYEVAQREWRIVT